MDRAEKTQRRPCDHWVLVELVATSHRRSTAARSWKRARNESYQQPGGSVAQHTPWLQTSGKKKEEILLVLSHPFGGNLSQKRQETNTWGDIRLVFPVVENWILWVFVKFYLTGFCAILLNGFPMLFMLLLFSEISHLILTFIERLRDANHYTLGVLGAKDAWDPVLSLRKPHTHAY